jgi:acetylcholinesterase
VYRYFYNASFTNLNWSSLPGVSHASEMPMVFGTLPTNSTVDQISLSQLMQASWANFAKTLDPGPGWVRLSTGSGKQNNDQRALNVLNIQAGRQQQPVIESTMASWGGAGRCYPWLEVIYGAVGWLHW